MAHHLGLDAAYVGLGSVVQDGADVAGPEPLDERLDLVFVLSCSAAVGAAELLVTTSLSQEGSACTHDSTKCTK